MICAETVFRQAPIELFYDAAVSTRLLSHGEANERRFSGGSEQLLSIRLAISRQSEHQPFRRFWSVASGELTEDVGFLVVLSYDGWFGMQPAALDEHVDVVGAIDRLGRPVAPFLRAPLPAARSARWRA